MKLLFKIFFGVVLIAAGIAVLSAGKSGKQEAIAAQSSTFYYYPKVNIYYDVAKSTYIYLANDGKTWESGRQVSDKLTTGMGKKAVLNNPPLPVWKNNEQHRIIYSTSLYASASDFRKNLPKKKPKIGPVTDTKKAEPEKAAKKESGIERFFKRLFKKKNSSEEKDKKQSA